MNAEQKEKFKKMLIEERNTPTGMAVIMAMVGMVENDERFEHLAELYEGIEEFNNYATEKEARKVVEHFENFDGSRGGKWTNIDVISDELRKFGGLLEEKGHYNKWMMFILLNNAYSDYGGVAMKLAEGKDLVKACYMMALAKLDDRDRNETIREYFGLE